MKILIILGLLFTSILLSAQEIIPLFRNDSLTTFVALPFRLRDSQQNALAIMSLEITSSQENCKAMIDPHISSNFLVKCTKAGPLSLNIYYKKSDHQIIKIKYGPILINQISQKEVIHVGEDPLVKYGPGLSLYVQHCQECHTNHKDKMGASSTSISQAIQSQTKMMKIDSLKALSETDLKAISEYLKYVQRVNGG